MFSKGRVLIPYLRNRLSPESLRALFCLGAWSLAGLVDRSDLMEIAEMDDVEEQEGETMY